MELFVTTDLKVYEVAAAVGMPVHITSEHPLKSTPEKQ